MATDDDDERLMAPQEAADVEREDRVEELAEERRDEDEAEADVEEEASTTADRAGHYEELMAWIQSIFKGDELDLDDIEGLSADEKAALRVLAEAVRGSYLEDEGDMIYAEHRLEMLNQALAVLQPTLALGLSPELAALRDQYDTLVEEVTDLRDHLAKLDMAQEELFEQDKVRDKVDAAGAGDTDDKPEDAIWPEVPYPGEPPRPSTLAGRAGEKPVEQPARPSTLEGKPGEKPVEQPPKPSTVWDPKS